MVRIIFVPMCLLALACGGGSESTPTTPNTPTPAPTPSNRQPVITSMSMTAFGIQQLTAFSYSGSATDPDGDSLTYVWDLAGTAASGTSGVVTFSNGITGTARLTVSDGKGGTASDTRSFVVGSMSGNWSGTVDVTVCVGVVKPMTASLVQNQTLVTGTIGLPQGLCSFSGGTAQTDPAEPGRIDANGNLTVRFKVPPFTDVTFRGLMDQSGRRVSGGLFGSGHNGTPVILDKQ